MDRNRILEGFAMLDKDRVTELVVQSGLHEFGYGHDRERFLTALAYFSTALQHEALKAAKREDAEPVAFEFQHEDTGLIDFVDPQQVEWGFEKNNPRWQLIGPVFRHPTPAVVRQLVEAAKRAMNYAENVVMAEGVYFDHDDDLPFIESALAAAKETGI